MRRSHSLLVGALAGALLLGLTTGPAAAAEAVYREQPSAAWVPADGTVYAITQVGGATVVGGSFTQVRNPSTGQVVRRNRIAAFDRRTGALLSSFARGADGTVRVLETDGTRVYAGGTFTSIGGLSRSRLAALSGATGAALSTFSASSSGAVLALDVSAGTLYVGGVFTRLNGAARSRLGAVDSVTGALRTGFRPSANGTVAGLALVPGTSTLAVAGSFTTLSGASRSYLGSVATGTGAATRWAPRPECAGCSLLGVTARSDLVYGAVAGPGGRATAWRTADGSRAWSQYGDGDVQAVRLIGGTLYAGGHFGPQFGRVAGVPAQRAGIASMDATTGALRPWDPRVGGGSGVWAIAGDSSALWLGGSHTSVNGSGTAARLSRFVVQPTAG